MSWPAYSERFLHHSGNGWWIYWVPEKRRAIITHISVANASTAVVGVTAYIGPIAYYYLGSLAAYSAVQVPLRQVAYQREDIAIFIAGGARHRQRLPARGQHRPDGAAPLSGAVAVADDQAAAAGLRGWSSGRLSELDHPIIWVAWALAWGLGAAVGSWWAGRKREKTRK